MDALVDVLAQLRHGGLGDASHAHRRASWSTRQVLTPAILGDRDQCLLDGLAGLQEAGEVGAGPELVFGSSVLSRVSS